MSDDTQAPSSHPWETAEGAYYVGSGGATAWYSHPLHRAYKELVDKGQLTELSLDVGRSRVRMRQRKPRTQPMATAVGHAALEEANAQIEELKAFVRQLTTASPGADEPEAPAGAPDPPTDSSSQMQTVDRPTQRDDKAVWVRYGVSKGKGTEEELDALTKADLVTLLS